MPRAQDRPAYCCTYRMDIREHFKFRFDLTKIHTAPASNWRGATLPWVLHVPIRVALHFLLLWQVLLYWELENKIHPTTKRLFKAPLRLSAVSARSTKCIDADRQKACNQLIYFNYNHLKIANKCLRKWFESSALCHVINWRLQPQAHHQLASTSVKKGLSGCT